MATNLKQLTQNPDLLTGGHRACAGCTGSNILRQIMLTAGADTVVGGATGCMEVVTTIFPYTAWRTSFIHSAFENSAATVSGVETAFRSLKKHGELPVQRDKMNFIAFGGDGGTYDIGLQSLSGAMERGHNMLYVCYDNEAYMNTGIQRSSSTPHAATTTTSPAGKERMGKRHLKKDLLSIIAAHHIPYAASASVAYPGDLQRKVRYAMGIEGPTFLVVHSPCPLGWRHDSALTIEVARRAVETGLFPMVELERGAVTNVMPIRALRPVRDYLELQGRFAHLFDESDSRAIEELDHLQALANHNIQTFGLKGEGEDPVDTAGIARVGRGGPLAGRG